MSYFNQSFQSNYFTNVYFLKKDTELEKKIKVTIGIVQKYRIRIEMIKKYGVRIGLDYELY